MNSADLLNILSRHQGRDNGISMAALARETQMQTDTEKRTLRLLISQLREAGIAVCATPQTGYYMAETPEELRESCQFLHDRAMRSLLLASRMQRISLPDLLGQLKLNQA